MTDVENKLYDLAWVLYGLRTGWGYTYQRQIAKKLSISEKHLSEILNRKQLPSLLLLERWAALYKMKLFLQIGV